MTFVDDIIIACEETTLATELISSIGENIELKTIEGIKQQFKDKFTLRRKILGLNMTEVYSKKSGKYVREYIKLDQQDYISKIIEKFGTPDMKIKPTPATDYIKHNYVVKNEDHHNKQVAKIREIIGSLLYASTHSRPDIAYCTNYLSHFQLEPSEEVFHYALRILQYLKGTVNKGLIFRGKGSDNKITAYTDATYNSDNYYRSTVSSVYYYNNDLISWNVEVSKLTTLSPAESEMVAISTGIKQEQWLRSILEWMNGKKIHTTVIKTDSKAGINMINREGFNKRNRHVNIRLAYCRQYINENNINLEYVNTKEQIADLLTEPLTKSLFLPLVKHLVS